MVQILWFGVQTTVRSPAVRRTRDDGGLENLRKTLREQVFPEDGSKLVTISPGITVSIGRPSTKVPAGKHSSMMTMTFCPKNGLSRRASVAMLPTCTEADGLYRSSSPRMTPTLVMPWLANWDTHWSRISLRCATKRTGSVADLIMLAMVTNFPAPVGATQSTRRLPIMTFARTSTMARDW
jgi:hypothetical protein